MSFDGNLQPTEDSGYDLANKGAIHTHDSSANTGLSVSGNNGYLLSENSSTSTGLEWIAAAASGGIEESFAITTKTTTTPTSQTGVKGILIDCTAMTGGTIQCNVDGSAYGDLITAGQRRAYVVNPSSALNFVSAGAGRDFSTAVYSQTSTATTNSVILPYGLWCDSTGTYWCHCMANGNMVGGAIASSGWDITTLPASLSTKQGNPYNSNEAYGCTFEVVSGDACNSNSRNGTYGTGITTTSQSGSPYDASGAGVMTSNELNIDGTDNTPRGLDMNSTGEEWYTVGQQHNKMYHWQTIPGMLAGYALYINATTTGVLVDELDHSAQFTGDGLDCSVTSDGLFLAILSQSGNVYGYELSSAWDLSTASFTSSFSTTAQSSDIRGVQIKDDGTSIFILDGQNAQYNPIYEYDISGAVTGTCRIAIIGS